MFKMIVKNIFYWIFFIPFAYIIIHFTFIKDGFEIGERQEEITSYAGELINEITIGETFISKKDNLSSIDIAFNTFFKINSHKVTFHLMEINSLYKGDIVREPNIVSL